MTFTFVLQVLCVAWMVYNGIQLWKVNKDIDASRRRIHRLLEKSGACTGILAKMQANGDVPFEYRDETENALFEFKMTLDRAVEAIKNKKSGV